MIGEPDRVDAAPADVDGAEPFDVCGALPTGTTVLEASAGTGKTFTIAALATRYVAEGVADLAQLMLVTFSRAATQELRERVRDRLATAERGLADPVAARASGDAVVALLAAAPDDEVTARRARLTRALASFDAATIATTHGFAQQMLAGLGMAGDTEPDATFVERIDDVVAEVVDDLYVRKFARSPIVPAIRHADARKVARDAMADRQATLVPADATEGSAAQQRYGLATAVRREVDARKRARRLLDYDDLLTRLRDALDDPARGAAARQRIRSRYRVVLVDEFQDTDPVQWDILRTTFHGYTTLVLIGDPKQAIYAFRGADLVTYLGAVRDATTKRTLGRNWRTDAPVVGALAGVLGGAALGDPGIVVRPVTASHAERRLTGAGAPVRLRVATRARAGRPEGGLPTVGETRPLVARDLARDVAALLRGGARVAVDEPPRAVRPGDIAVLVRTNDQATLVRDALAERGVPAVLTGSRSVFLAPIARDWLTLLRAIEQPHRSRLARAAALTCFVGWSAQRLAAAGDAGADELGARMRRWRDVLTARGVAALLELITSSERLMERLLATPTGERDLTDVRHVGEALHGAAVTGDLGPAALVDWLERRIAEAKEDSAEERSRRLDIDTDAAQVVTVHSAKGLEFPIVYVPYAWDRPVPRTPDPLRLHAPDGTRLLDVGGPDGPGWAERRAAHDAEEYGEDLRLLYVAVTRAQCQVVAWWLPSTTTASSPLHRLLFDDFGPGEQPRREVTVPSDGEAWRRLEARAAGTRGGLAVELIRGDDGGEAWRPVATAAPAPAARGFDRRLDEAWRRTSYTALTAPLHAPGTGTGAGVGSEPETGERADEPGPVPASLEAAPEPVGPAADADLRDLPSPMADLPSGAAFGTVVHRVLETVDTAADDLAAELAARCADAVGERYGTTIDPAALAAGLLPALRTPLGPLADGLTLADVAPRDRLAELEFELPLAGGDEPRAGDAAVAAIATALRRHLGPDDPLAGYADALDVPVLREQRLRGYLTGSIDAVLRVRGDGAERFVVVDYKTNWLGAADASGREPLTASRSLTAWNYRPAALVAEMLRAHYPLQALLYEVALHRFLRWRVAAYDPQRHLGGALYLFVRGMCGPGTPVVDGAPTGVLGWRPPAALVTEVSDLLDGGRR